MFETIDSREKLFEVIKQLNLLIEQGELIQIFNENDLFCTKTSLSDFLKTREIPDLVRCYFVKKETAEKFLLSVETYHGIGGELKKIE